MSLASSPHEKTCDGPKVVFCKVNTINDYYALCGILSKEEWIYRGHEDSSWLLENSLEREIAKQDIIKINQEVTKSKQGVKKAIQEIQKKKQIERYFLLLESQEYHALQAYKSRMHQNNMSNIEALCNLQHYGGKTRLLDFSFSINIALFFAFENKNIFKERCIWGINYNKLHGRLFESKKQSNKYLKNEYSKYNNKYDIKDEELDNAFALSCIFNYRNINRKVNLDIADKCIRDLMINNPCQDYIIPVEIPDQNPRITAQNGLFLFTTSFKTFSESLSRTFGLEINNL